MNHKWQLLNNQEHHYKPRTQEHELSDDILEKLEKGSKILLGFHANQPADVNKHLEYLWVEILLVQDEKYLGQLEENSTIISDLKKGQLIEFETEHIFDTEYIDPFNSSIKI